MNIWFNANSKLEEIVENLSGEFSLVDPYMDKESLWQWIECIEARKSRKFDISRRCSYETEEFNEPVRVTVYDEDGFVKEEEIEEIARKISKVLNIPVFTGNIISDEMEKVKYIINKEIRCS